MAKQSCDNCGRTITVAGGIANLWTFSNNDATGMVLEFEDGSSHLLCYPCIEALPENPSESDLGDLEPAEPSDTTNGDDESDRSSRFD